VLNTSFIKNNLKNYCSSLLKGFKFLRNFIEEEPLIIKEKIDRRIAKKPEAIVPIIVI
tara:strand:- start:15 stop:188 length:174 start_codon:yes stop_codon:yes gene_type:complete